MNSEKGGCIGEILYVIAIILISLIFWGTIAWILGEPIWK
jgi:hypothetical protein